MKAMKEIWAEALKTLRNEVTAVSYDLWITTLEPFDLVDNVLYLTTTSETAKARVLKLHEGQILQALLLADPEIKNFQVFDPTERERYLNAKTEKMAPLWWAIAISMSMLLVVGWQKIHSQKSIPYLSMEG